MALSHRRLAVACALPVVAVTIAMTAWAGWYAGAGRDRLARLGGQATLQHSTTEALSALSAEIYALGALNALPRRLPEVLRPYSRPSAALPGGGRGLLETSDRTGAAALDRLTLAGAPLRPGTRRALARLGAEDVDRAASGRMPQGVTIADYAGAAAELQGLFAAMPRTTQDAVDALVDVGREPPPWRQPGFLGALVGAWALAVGSGLALARLVGRRLRASQRELDAERGRVGEQVRRNARLLELTDAGYRVSSRTDVRSLADGVATEAARLLAGDAAVVYLVEGDRAVPIGAFGPVRPQAVDLGDGVLGRALDTGAPTRAAVEFDPALPGLAPASLVAAPLIAGRRIIGALLVGRAGDALPDDDDALALRLIALAAATAIEAARAHDSVSALALTDALTGLGNRRRLDDDLPRACAADAPQPVGFAMIDVDHFKAYNDAHGHPAGDAVLRRVAAIAAANVRDQDVVYRFGGEELCVILPGADRAEATRVAERVCAAVAAEDFAGGASQPGGRVTVSAGVACDEGPRAADLMAAADAALYRAKSEGRDRVVTAVPGPV